MLEPFLSICIPSYNRPEGLQSLLASIDCHPEDVEIVICEDCAPKRNEVNAVVNRFRAIGSYDLRYLENPVNLGFDGNLRRLIECASGQYVMFMGDDDFFVPKALDKYILFLKSNQDKRYVLRCYLTEHTDGTIEYFRYLPKATNLAAGESTVAWLFKRSVTISGFTISRAAALEWATPELDGTLLYQVYLMAQVCLDHSSVYCDIPVVHSVQSFRQDRAMFGSSGAESNRYTPGIVSPDNSINFTKAYFELTDYLDHRRGTNLTKLVRKDLAKYSYPFLSIQRKRGLISFLRYANRLEREIGFGSSPYFHIYKWSLFFLGERSCDWVICQIKTSLGYTPNF